MGNLRQCGNVGDFSSGFDGVSTQTSRV